MQQADQAPIIARQFGDLTVLAHPPAKMLKALAVILAERLEEVHRPIRSRQQ